jgi:hypothetical protein
LKTWLTNGYDDKTKIEADYKRKVLTKEKRDALMAVHDCDGRVVTEPSARDRELLNKIYHSTSVKLILTGMIIIKLSWLSVSGRLRAAEK